MTKLFSDFLERDPDTVWKNAGKPQVDVVGEARKKLVKTIDDALKSLKDGFPEMRGIYKTKADMAQVTLRVGRTILPIEKRDRNVVRTDKLKPFLEAVRKAALSGQLDPDIMSAVVLSDNKPSSSRADSWTPERKAAHSERIKAAWEKRRATAKA